MKTYRKIATVEAKLFEPGDETGSSCIPYNSICKFQNKEGKYKQCLECLLNIPKKPFITTLENNTHYGEFYRNYLCAGINGEKWLVDKDIFEKTYIEI